MEIEKLKKIEKNIKEFESELTDKYIKDNIFLVPKKNLKIKIGNQYNPNNIKLISNYSDIENEKDELQIINEKILISLGLKKEKISAKKLKYMKISRNIQQILFKDKIKLNIRNNKILSIVEARLILKKIIPENKGNNNKFIKDENNVFHCNIINSQKKVEKKLENIYKKINMIIQDKNNLFEKIKNNIDVKNIINNYIIVDKNWYNELINIFPKGKNFNEEKSFVESSIDKKEICSKKSNDLNSKLDKLKNNELLKVKFKKINEVEYPFDYELIKEKYLEFLGNVDIYELKYQMILGENLIFIIDKNNGKNVYICSLDKNNVEVEAILLFEKEGYLELEIENHIKNKRGLENYFKERRLDPTGRKIQKIFNQNKCLGNIIIIKNKNYVKENNNKQFNNINNNNKLLSINGKKVGSQYDINNSYLKALFICLFKIEKLRLDFKNINNDKKNITNTIYNFMKNNEINFNQINDIQQKINQINSNILKDLNFEKIINFILNQLHNELNERKKIDMELPKEDYDEQMAYNNYKDYYFAQNESIIQRIFFGLNKISSFFKCCQLINYKFEIISFIPLDLDKINEQKTLQDLIIEWENIYNIEKTFCKMCHLNCETLVQNQLYDNPEILMIIIKSNKNKIQVNVNKNIQIKNYEYNLLSCICQSEKEYNKNHFNVIYKELNNWYVYKNNIEPEKVGNELENLLLYPYVLFYERGNKIIINESLENSLNNSNLRYDSLLLSISKYNLENNKNFNESLNDIGINNLDIKESKFINNTRYDDINIYDSNNLLKTNIINLVNFIDEKKIFKSIKINNENNNNKNNILKNQNTNDKINNFINDNIIYNQNCKINNNQNIYLNNNINNKIINNNIFNNFQYNEIKNNYINDFRNNNNNKVTNYLNDNLGKNDNLNLNNNMNNNNNKINIDNQQMLNNNINNNTNNLIYNNVFNYYPYNDMLMDQNMINYFKKNHNIFQQYLENNNLYKNDKNTEKIKINVFNKDSEDKQIILFFVFENGKELYIEIEDDSLKFSEVINLLKEKYSWLNDIQIKEYVYNSEKIILEKSIKEIGLKDLSRIRIIEL